MVRPARSSSRNCSQVAQGDQVGVGDQDPRRVAGGAEDADRLAALDEEGFVAFQPLQLGDDGVEGIPARRAAGATVDDEVVRVLGDLGIEVVHEHPERGFLLPTLAGDLRAARRANGARPDFGAVAVTGSMLRPARLGELVADGSGLAEPVAQLFVQLALVADPQVVTQSRPP